MLAVNQLHYSNCRFISCVRTLDCWLEISEQPGGPATDQLDQGFPLVFLGPRTNIQSVPTHHFPAPVPRNRNTVTMPPPRPPQTHNSAQLLTFLPLMQTPNSPLNKISPCLQPAFTRRITGHCLGTYRAGNYSKSPPPPTSQPFLLLFLCLPSSPQ